MKGFCQINDDGTIGQVAFGFEHSPFEGEAVPVPGEYADLIMHDKTCFTYSNGQFHYTPKQEQSHKTLEEEVEALKAENAKLKDENTYLRSRDTIIQDDVNFILETLVTNGLV